MTKDSPPPLLVVEGISKHYGTTTALDDVSLNIEGGIFGLLGANGAGKSTLFRALLDLVRLDKGHIRVGGYDTVREGIEARQLIGYSPENLLLDDCLTGWEHLEFVAGLRGLDNEKERRGLLDEFGLDDSRHHLMGSYSLGMRKKTGLAAALMGNPRLVLLDEPLNGLDTEHMRRLRERIEAMASAGTTFLVSSHVMAFVERICQQLAILQQGRIVAQGTVMEVRAQAGMADEPFEDVFLALAVVPQTDHPKTKTGTTPDD
jgi:ABC-2 type transport system ATP-binding protein